MGLDIVAREGAVTGARAPHTCNLEAVPGDFQKMRLIFPSSSTTWKRKDSFSAPKDEQLPDESMNKTIIREPAPGPAPGPRFLFGMQVYSEEPGQAILWNASLVLLK